jgi:uncharacterized protein (TIGR02301 family)
MAKRKIGILAAAIAAALAGPVMAQNLLERSIAPPTYESPREEFVQPQHEAPATAALPAPNPTAPALPPLGNPATGANPAQPGTAPSAEEPPPPYEPQLLRLSELLGALTYLQDLCGGRKGQIWRDKMTALMDAETQNETRKERLAGAYNRGFQGYELNYRQCTPNAQAIISRFLDESGKIARDVTHRYGTS